MSWKWRGLILLLACLVPAGLFGGTILGILAFGDVVAPASHQTTVTAFLARHFYIKFFLMSAPGLLVSLFVLSTGTVRGFRRALQDSRISGRPLWRLLLIRAAGLRHLEEPRIRIFGHTE